MSSAPDPGSRDTQDADALITDGYLESILAAHARGADMGPRLAETQPNPDVRRAAEHLSASLVRLHPSFRFEESLAGKLSAAATRMRLPLAAGRESVLVPLAEHRPFIPIAAIDDDVPFRLRDDPRLQVGRPLLIGGALTSAALSLAGAAYVAWRMRRPQVNSMARAVRAVARTRLA